MNYTTKSRMTQSLDAHTGEVKPSGLVLDADFQEPAIHHGWWVDRSDDLPCGCETVAEAALVDLPGMHNAIIRQTGSSVRCTLHHASCVRCGERMIVVENGSLHPRWAAQAFMATASGAWVKVAMPAQLVDDLLLDRLAVDVSRPTSICAATLNQSESE